MHSWDMVSSLMIHDPHISLSVLLAFLTSWRHQKALIQGFTMSPYSSWLDDSFRRYGPISIFSVTLVVATISPLNLIAFETSWGRLKALSQPFIMCSYLSRLDNAFKSYGFIIVTPIIQLLPSISSSFPHGCPSFRAHCLHLQHHYQHLGLLYFPPSSTHVLSRV